MATETELKLQCTPEGLEQLLQHPRLAGIAPRRQWLRNTYYDTPEQALQQARMALRLRRTECGVVQTLKTAGEEHGGLSRRGEWEWALNEEQPDTDALRDVGLSGLTPDLLDRLEPAFTTDFHRTTWHVTFDDIDIELAFDQGTIQAGGNATDICEIELELKTGHSARQGEQALLGLARTLTDTLACRPANASKAARAARLAKRQWPQAEPDATAHARLDAVIAGLDAYADSGEQRHYDAACQAARALANDSDPAIAVPAESLTLALTEGQWLSTTASGPALALIERLYMG
ncbi:CYTH domain-containing protein [Larsenimonas rhizosphaerae]|uniref:CYTH domain-containing protein n=1 Tax=Larsenimonas rhizosphaerae TaxID=2944682 RepID=UPI00203449AF|nr:CYTH domain-containing protein [Larsenimonas rhizosphaerae]MCM2130025.1 CYTH domain-containing protein [Larsenimonas rhizosphaerae]